MVGAPIIGGRPDEGRNEARLLDREAWQEYLDNVVYPAMEQDFEDYRAEGGDLPVRGDDVLGAVRGVVERPRAKKEAKTAVTAQGGCFARLCRDFGLELDKVVLSVSGLTDSQRKGMWVSNRYKIYVVVYGDDHPKNHVEAVEPSAKTAHSVLEFKHSNLSPNRTVAVTTAQQFFGPASGFADVKFYATEGDKAAAKLEGDSSGAAPGGFGSFGASLPAFPNVGGSGSGGYAYDKPRGPASVVDEFLQGGSANITSGVTRPRRRVIQAKQGVFLGKYGAKNYRTAGVTMFNNVDELFLDKLSRSAAQEVVERLFTEWGVPMADIDAVSYAEDLLWAFLIARTASNKADYNVEFDVPVAGGANATADFSQLSRLLEGEFRATRRAFVRGVADELRSYLSRDDNKFMLPVVAQRVGADPQMATLCFDGSTHCTNLTTSEASFTKLLEARNLFERDDVVADGASSRLMQGMSGGVRSVVPR